MWVPDYCWFLRDGVRTQCGRVVVQGLTRHYRYYVLVAACVLARKSEWLRNACLAAALILPAIAAIHAIVLAALHVDGMLPPGAGSCAVPDHPTNASLDAIDLDIYGALQLCSIGILTAPACVRLSNTYFNSKGRNVLFLWTILVLAGEYSTTPPQYTRHHMLTSQRT